MSIAALIRAMDAAGASPEAIALAVEAIEQAKGEIATRRAADRERKQRQRDRSRDGHGTVTGLSADTPPEQKVSPGPPSKTQTPYTPSPPKGGSVPTILKFAKPDGFERFWEACPRKIGKGAARRAYVVALRKIEAPDPQAVLMAALERVKPTWRDAQFIPHPATWLNQERWEDEPELPPPREDEFAEARARVLERMG